MIGLSDVHKKVLDEFKDQLLIAFLKRLGGTVDMPIREVDDTGQDRLAFSIRVPDAPTGELKLDARIHGVFHFELVKKS